MKILDWYILKRYLVTFVFTILILIPIAVAIDISEKVDKFLSHSDLTAMQIIDEYYKNFIIYYTNTFMPLALFIAVILFTTKLSNNTEIVAMTSARISFTRFLRPYMVGATLVTVFALLMNHFVVPSSSKERKAFEKEYLTFKRSSDNAVRNFSLQLNDSTYVYIKRYNFKTSVGTFFAIENYSGIQLKQKLTADNIRWNKDDATFILTKYKIRKVYKEQDSIFSGLNIDTAINMNLNSFLPIFKQKLKVQNAEKWIQWKKICSKWNTKYPIIEKKYFSQNQHGHVTPQEPMKIAH